MITINGGARISNSKMTGGDDKMKCKNGQSERVKAY